MDFAPKYLVTIYHLSPTEQLSICAFISQRRCVFVEHHSGDYWSLNSIFV